jgi:CMP-N-acetylneuraminic acid synthetase
MYKNKSVYCLIAARAGSTGIPKKNSKVLAGKPLIIHSIDIAKKVKQIDEIYVSTDGDKIRQISLNAGVNVIDRPKKISKSTSNILDTWKHMINSIPRAKDKDIIIVIFWPTTPIRNVQQIEKCIKMYNKNYDCIVSVMESKIRPAWLFIEKKGLLKFWQKGKPENNRQEQKETYYYINGAIVVTNSRFLQNQKETFPKGRMKGFLMDEKHSMDIDTKFDFQLCKMVMESKF